MAPIRFIKETLSLDYRSLALYRFFIGLIVMADVLYRWPDLRDFYTDAGLIPRALFTGEMSMNWSFSLHLANGSMLFIYVMFFLQLVLGFFVVVGYKTRWALFFSYLLNVSVHNRNWLVNNGGDDILRSLLFLSIFLPLAECFSVDSAFNERNEKKDYSGSHFSTWGLAIFFQVFAIYFVSYLLKDHPIWRKDFTGVFYASRLDIFATPLGVWLRNFPYFQKLTTIFTIYLECLGPLALVFSCILGRFWWVGRTTIVFLFWFLHAGIILTMWIGIFPFTCIVMWSLFLPTPFWDRACDAIQKRFQKISLYYDGDCNFCKKSVLIFREFFLVSDTKIEPAQNSSEINNLMKKHNSMVVVNDQNQKFFKYEAFIELARNSPLLFWFLPILKSRPAVFIGNNIYHWVSNNRQEVSKLSQFFPLTQPKKKVKTFSFLYQAAGLLIVMTLFMWNLTTIKRWGITSPFFQNITRYLHLYQEWNMFSPFPKMDNAWVEVNGKLSDGTELEIITNDRDILSIKASAFVKTVKNEHWRKFFMNMSDRADYQRYFGGFLCRKWNERKIRTVPNTTLRKMEIIAFSQPNLADGSRGGISRRMSWTHWCFDEDFKRESGQDKKK